MSSFNWLVGFFSVISQEDPFSPKWILGYKGLSSKDIWTWELMFCFDHSVGALSNLIILEKLIEKYKIRYE